MLVFVAPSAYHRTMKAVLEVRMAVWSGSLQNRRRRESPSCRRRCGRSDGRRDGLTGPIGLLITGGAGSAAVNGTVKVPGRINANDDAPDQCLAGEFGLSAATHLRLLDLNFAEPPCPV